MNEILKFLGFGLLVASIACQGGSTQIASDSAGDPFIPFSDKPQQDESGGRPSIAPFPPLPPLPTTDDGPRDERLSLKINFSCPLDYSLCSPISTATDFTQFLTHVIAFDGFPMSREFRFCIPTRNLEAYREVVLWHLQAVPAEITSCRDSIVPGSFPVQVFEECWVNSENPNFCEDIRKTTPPGEALNPYDDLTADFSVTPSPPVVGEAIYFQTLGKQVLQDWRGPPLRWHWYFQYYENGKQFTDEVIGFDIVKRWYSVDFAVTLEIEVYETNSGQWIKTYPIKTSEQVVQFFIQD